MQQGQVFELKKRAVDGSPVWAYRYRTGGPGSRRLQRGGFFSERDATEALERSLERLRRQNGVGSTLTLTELVVEYLAQYDAEPETIEKLCWLLAKALRAFGGRRLPELRSQEIAAWRMTISPGHRFEATQALRQVLARAVVWGMIDSNPAKQGVDNPQRRRTEKRPFESWAQLDGLAAWLGPRYGPAVLFAAATGLRPASGWRSSSATSTATRKSSTSVAPSETAGSRARRPRGASARCRCRPPRSQRSTSSVPILRVRFSSRRPAVVTSMSTTSATATGNPPKSRRASCRCAASTISATRSQPSPSAPASQPSTSRATWEPA